MRAVLDTNVIISAVAARARPIAGILAAWRAGTFDWVTSPPMLDELYEALGYPRVRRLVGWSERERMRFLADLMAACLIVEPAPGVRLTLRDPDDLVVIRAAAGGNADYVVTGDGDLLAVGEYAGIAIVTPARFLAMLSGLP
jgi:putative PIN family toxin of toxin-antitoxin system